MKKYLVIVLLVFTLILTACGGSKDTNTRIDEPSATLYEILKLDSVKNGKSIKEVDTTKKNYYDIKVAEDTKASLFAYSTMIDSLLEEHGTRTDTFNVAPLTFSSQITTTEATEIMKEIFNGETGVTKEKLGVSFDLKATSIWGGSLSAEDVVKKYDEQNQRNNCVAVVYLPVHIKHVAGGKSSLEVFAMIPVYYELTTVVDGIIQSSAFDGIATPTISFNEKNLLN